MWIYEKWEGPCVVTIFEKKLILLLLVSFVDKRNGNIFCVVVTILELFFFSSGASVLHFLCGVIAVHGMRSASENENWGEILFRKDFSGSFFCNNSTKSVRGTK